MSLLQKCQKLLTRGECLRPIDYMILLAIVMMTIIRFWWRV